ncbi:MAG: Gfo/Idh/MocA family oxidoreductase [Alkalispirochaeta sp.]
MKQKKQLRIGTIGYGFMGWTHAVAFTHAAKFFDSDYVPVLQTVCARNRDNAQVFADKWGYKNVETDWQKVVASPDIDLIDICVPNNLHAEIAIAAAKAGKMVMTEKPLAMSTAEGEKMVEAVKSAGVANMVWYNYRRIPAVTLAKQVIDSGKLGRIFHLRAQFLQDWTISAKVPQGGTGTWRLDVAAAGSGVTGDLLAHCIDTAMWWNGPITRVSARTETFVKEREHVESGKTEPVGIDDACVFLCDFENGSLGNFESTRYARGHKAKYYIEINGEHASLAWDLHDLHRLSYFDHSDESIVRGWRSIHVTDGDQPYMSKWWRPGLSIGYESSFTHQAADFLAALSAGETVGPTFEDGLQTQKVCEAVLESGRDLSWKETGAGKLL